MSFVRQHKGAIVWSLALHVAVAAAVAIGVPWRIERPRVSIAAAPIIEGVMIDRAAIEREQAKRDEAARQVRQQQQREERQRREAAEQQRLAEQREQQRAADAQRARDEAARKEEERVAAEKAEQRRRDEQAKAEREAQARREREAQARREREEADKRAAEQRRRQAAEAELAAQIALEAEQNAARQAGLEDQYIRMIESKIKQEWNRPLSARPGIDCVVTVVQVPTGDVISARVASCNGDEAVRRSIERAVMDASPLPKPPHPSLFQRNLNVTFRPEE
jgi:colicin import membrane protein